MDPAIPHVVEDSPSHGRGRDPVPGSESCSRTGLVAFGMLRRDVQYILTGVASEHCWRAKPVAVDEVTAIAVGVGATRVNVVAIPGNALHDESH